MARVINSLGLELLKKYEGCSLTPYKDLGGKLTIGYGHLIKADEDYSAGITQDEADARLFADLDPIEDAVQDAIDVALTDNQFSALVCLCYNVGTAPLTHTLGSILNGGAYQSAADEFLRWDYVHIGDKPIESNGLLARRKEERALFLS